MIAMTVIMGTKYENHAEVHDKQPILRLGKRRKAESNSTNLGFSFKWSHWLVSIFCEKYVGFLAVE